MLRAVREATLRFHHDVSDHRSLAEVKQKMETMLHAHRLDLLRIGAGGELYMAGELEEVLPLDDRSIGPSLGQRQPGGNVIEGRAASAPRIMLA